jgi:hypothetical protein
MFSQFRKTSQPTICNYMPGFAFYEGIGNRLAESLVNIFEAIADSIGKFRI